ncbi:hypothetical protein [Pilimelia columellifera]|uniref:TrbC/VIRB2 family protein n=1 Tax=Pilimelia columellifera subsp. columellifera TaxID=706583 RepID=A0ABN3NCJ3_9ACTN
MNASDLIHAAVAAGDPRDLLVALAAAPPKGINTEGVVGFFASKVAPILLAVLGVIFIGRASRGEISKVLTSSAIAIVGLAFIAGAATLFFIGEYLIGLIFA